MKFIHTADIHLGSNIGGYKISSFNQSLAKDIERKVRSDLDNSLRKISNYARDNKIEVILICGDLFDTDHITNDVYNKFKSIVNEYKDLKYYYVLGNHDAKSIFKLNEKPANLYDFYENSISYSVGDIQIYGFNHLTEYKEDFYEKIRIEDSNKFNIVMMHGYPSSNIGKISQHIIDITYLKNKGVNYYALGHEHKRRILDVDKRAICVSSGNPVGRNFADGELGEKGFFVVDTKDYKNPKFIKLDNAYEFYKLTIDVSDINSFDKLVSTIKSKVKSNHYVDLTLTGQTSFDLDTQALFDALNLPIQIDNQTRIKFDFKKLEKEQSLKGEFVRKAKAALQKKLDSHEHGIDYYNELYDQIIDLVLREFKR